MATLSKKFSASVKEYRVALRSAHKGSAYNPGPWEVARNVPRFVYDAWVDTVPAVWKIAYVENAGLIVIYGDPLTPHSRTAGWLSKEFGRQIERHLGSDILDSLDFSTEDFNIPGYGVKVPDLSIIPQKLRRGVSIPCVAVEVGYHNERSFEEVRDEALLWAGYGCPVVIGVKITDNAPPATVHSPRVEVVLKLQGHQEQIFQLGQGSSVPCTQTGTHELHIPALLLQPRARRSSKITQTLPVISLDLFPLQERIEAWVFLH